MSFSLTLVLSVLCGTAAAEAQFERSGDANVRPSQSSASRSEARPITRPPEFLDGTEGEGERRPGSGKSVWTTLGALTLVVALILLLGRLWKKHGPAAGAGIPPEAIEVLGRRFLNNRQTIYLVRLGTRILVLGSTAGGLQALSEVTDPVEVDYLAGLCRGKESEGSIAESFRGLFQKRTGPSSPADAAAASSQRAPSPTPEDNRAPHTMPEQAHV